MLENARKFQKTECKIINQLYVGFKIQPQRVNEQTPIEILYTGRQNVYMRENKM